MGKDKNKDKEHHDGETAASETNSPQDACRDSQRDLQKPKDVSSQIQRQKKELSGMQSFWV